jgi:gamma-glutamylcysteine synthetase
LQGHLKPLPYEGRRSIRAMLEGLRDRFGWKPDLEGGNLIGLKKDGANISLEPGGQLELSGAPLETIHQTCDEVNSTCARSRIGRRRDRRGLHRAGRRAGSGPMTRCR